MHANCSEKLENPLTKFPLFERQLVGTISWDFGSLECVLLLCGNFQSRGNFIRGIDWAYQNLKKWPLRCQKGDFMLSKLNNRLVKHHPSRNPAF